MTPDDVIQLIIDEQSQSPDAEHPLVADTVEVRVG